MILTDWIVIAIAYFLGSIPCGLLLAKAVGIKDLREKGSGNIGATNVTRVGGKKLGAVTLLFDGGKGAVAVWISSIYSSTPDAMALACIAVIFGHIFPVWLKFKGGKGVATTLAVLLSINLYLGFFSLAVWVATFFLTRISSVSAIVSMIATPILAYYILDMRMVYLTAFFSTVVIARHHSNIKRLLKHEE